MSVLGLVVFFEVANLRSRQNQVEVSRSPMMGDQLRLAGSVQGLGEAEILGETESGDARVEIARRYLEKYKSPLVPQAELIVNLADKYGFEYYWILAIGQQESNLCKKIPQGSHNCWGYGINSAGTLGFDSYESALTSFAEYLDREYFKKGRNTAELIMKKYCPHSNGSWAYGVNYFVEEIESGRFDL